MVFPKELHYWDGAFPRVPVEAYYARFRDAAPDQICGEITPAYAILPPETIAAIGRELPAVKILFLLRNPIDRTWSTTRFDYARNGKDLETASLDDLLKALNGAGALRRSDYETCLRNWLAVFPREQIHLDFYDRVQADPTALLCDCARFLGISEVAYRQAEDQNLFRRKIFKSPEKAMPEAVRECLLERYAPMIERLGAFLGTDLSHWIRAYER